VPQGERAGSGMVFGIFLKFNRTVYNADMAYVLIDDQLVKS